MKRREKDYNLINNYWMGVGCILITIFSAVGSLRGVLDQVHELFEIVLVQLLLPLKDDAAVTVAIKELLDAVQVVVCTRARVVLVLVTLGAARAARARFKILVVL